MVKNGTNIQFTYPDGTVHIYVPSGSSWTPATNNPDLLTQSGTNFYLRCDSGFIFHFVKLTGGSGQVYYQLQNFTDSFGNNYPLTYDAAGRLALVTEPAGRWLRVTYQDVTVNQDQFTTLYAQAATPAAGWNQVTVSNPATFRYLRYFSTEPGAQGSYCDVAEVEFYDTAGNKLAGTAFGSTPAYNNGSNTFAKAFDGSTGTFFDFQSPHFGFTGIDLGSGNAKAVGKVRFFPRGGYEGRMNGNNPETGVSGCRFEGANVAPVTESVIAEVEAGYGSGANQVVTRTVNYNYAAFADPALAGSNWLTLTGAAYGDGAAAVYTYQSLYAGQRPLLASADDPRMVGEATKIKYEFWKANGNVFGAIYAEHDFTSNQILAKFEGDGTATGRRVTYANGAVHRLVGGNINNMTGYTDAVGNQTGYAYSANNTGFLQSRTDPLNHTTAYTRDTQGRTLSTTYADNSYETWTRDALGHVLTHKDARGYTTNWTRDTNGRATRIDYPDGGYETFTYNGFGQVLSHRQTNGGTESFVYNDRGLKTDWVNALNYTTKYSYDIKDLLVSVTDPLNRTVTYTYNERGQTTKTTYADSNSTTYGYDAYGNQLSVTNELGNTWNAAFDAYKRRITMTDPLNRTTQYWYDEPGAGSTGCGGCGSGMGGASSHITTIISPGGKTTKINYDLAWRKIGETVGYNTATAATTGYGYDSAGNLVTTNDPRGAVTMYTYDARNRRSNITDPLGNIIEWTYDASGNMLTEKRADGNVMVYEYDAMDRRTKVTDPLIHTTQMAYDTAGNLINTINANNDVSNFAYDLLNQKLRILYSDATHEDWNYDACGNISTYKTRAGQTKTHTVNRRNWETAYTWSDGTPGLMKTYDARGRLLSSSSSVSILSYTYDNGNQLLSETSQIVADGTARTVSYTYDVDGNQSSLTYPSGSIVTYSYTARNQLSTVAIGSTAPLVTYTYDLNGRRTQKALENGTIAINAYDNAGRLSSITHQKTGVTFASFNYGYNSINNRTWKRIEDNTGETYSYDATDQITKVQYGVQNPDGMAANPNQTVVYTYDSVGNRTQTNYNGLITPYTASGTNEYTSVGGASLTYDGNGNLTSYNGWIFGYDAQNRLVNVAGGPDNVNASLVYDQLNRCVSRTINGSTTFYVYDAWNLITEYNNGLMVNRYIHGEQVDEPLAKVGVSSTVYYHQDGLGSVVQLTDVNGQTVEKYSYDVFGQVSVMDALGSVQSDSIQGNRFLFVGREWLSAINLYDYRNRYYSPKMGRFLQIDPLRASADINLYKYAFNVPNKWIDPLGLEATMTCTRCKEDSNAPLNCTIEEDGKKGKPFQCNTKGYYNPGTPQNPYPVNGPIPPGSYNLLPKPPGQMDDPPNPNEYQVGTPSITQPGQDPGKCCGGSRDNLRVHPPGKGPGPDSEGCLACKNAGEIKKVMDRNPGHTKVVITEVSCAK